MKKILAIILIIIGISFLTWKFMELQLDLIPSLLFNIAGFLPIAIGFALFKTSKVSDPKKNEVNEISKIKPEVIEPHKTHKTEDHSNYMPK